MKTSELVSPHVDAGAVDKGGVVVDDGGVVVRGVVTDDGVVVDTGTDDDHVCHSNESAMAHRR